MKIWIANRQRRIPLRVETYRILAEKALLKLGRPEAEIGLSFLSDSQIRVLNRAYRGFDRPTDVLSFSLAHTGTVKMKADSPCFLGDVVISVPTARRQALARQHGLRREITELMIHGILHLLGYDHEKSSDARRMRRMENMLLKECIPAGKPVNKD